MGENAESTVTFLGRLNDALDRLDNWLDNLCITCSKQGYYSISKLLAAIYYTCLLALVYTVVVSISAESTGYVRLVAGCLLAASGVVSILMTLWVSRMYHPKRLISQAFAWLYSVASLSAVWYTATLLATVRWAILLEILALSSFGLSLYALNKTRNA